MGGHVIVTSGYSNVLVCFKEVVIQSAPPATIITDQK